MSPKVEQLLNLIRECEKIKQIHRTCYELLTVLRDDVRAGKYTLDEMVNIIYVTREMSNIANDIRKEIDGIKHIFENVACAVYVTRNETSPIRASLATGSPIISLGVKVPNRKKEPERFQMLMDFFGVSPNLSDTNVVKPHWPGICEQISILAEEGKPLPPGISVEDTYPTYGMRIGAVRDIDELLSDINNVAKRMEVPAHKEEKKKYEEILTVRHQKIKESTTE